MRSQSLKIVTQNAIINSEYTLFLKHSKYFAPENLINEYPREDVIKITYRRLIRLKPFVSQRKMVQDTYVEYLRYKYKSEDYKLKSSLCNIRTEHTEASDLEQATQSLQFILKAVSRIESGSCPSAVDNTLCRKILKNLLTMEYYKQTLIRQSPTSNYQLLRKSFGYLAPSKDDKSDTHINSRYNSMGEYDRALVCLNEMLGTRL